jgi:hypothetical protein
MACGMQENKFVSCYDHITWNDKRLQGIATEDDKSETFVAQARTLLDTLEVMHNPYSCYGFDGLDIALTA